VRVVVVSNRGPLRLNLFAEKPVSSLRAQDARAEVLRQAAIICWDEASMIPKNAVNVLDTLLRDLTGIDAPFGGKLVVFGGDFRQVLPVVPHAPPEQVVGETIQYSKTWREGHFRIHSLVDNMRTLLAGGQNALYQDWLLRLGDVLVVPKHAAAKTNRKKKAGRRRCPPPRLAFSESMPCA
jgi:hypothetical protein